MSCWWIENMKRVKTDVLPRFMHMISVSVSPPSFVLCQERGTGLRLLSCTDL